MPIKFLANHNTIIFGQTGAGKTQFILRIIRERLIEPFPKNVYYMYSVEQPFMKQYPNIKFINDQANIKKHLDFKRIKSIDDLNMEINLAASENKSVMLDFYADWCVSCKEMETYTFTNKKVQDALSNTILIQADVTLNDLIDQNLLKKLDVFGPPTIIFYDQRGRRQIGYEVVGYMNADNFSEHVKEALQGTIGNAI